MEEEIFSETLACIYQATRRHMNEAAAMRVSDATPTDCKLHLRSCFGKLQEGTVIVVASSVFAS
jgi:hypothetical protein